MKRKDIEAEDEWRNVIKLESKRGKKEERTTEHCTIKQRNSMEK